MLVYTFINIYKFVFFLFYVIKLSLMETKFQQLYIFFHPHNSIIAATHRQNAGENIFGADAQHEHAVSVQHQWIVPLAEDRSDCRAEGVQGHYRHQEDEGGAGATGGSRCVRWYGAPVYDVALRWSGLLRGRRFIFL